MARSLCCNASTVGVVFATIQLNMITTNLETHSSPNLERQVGSYKDLIFPIQVISEDYKSLVRNNLVKLDDDLSDYSKESKIFTSFTVMYGSWKCNWKCPAFCYTKNMQVGELSVDRLCGLVEEAKSRGAVFTYWPGTGEVTLFKDFWKIQEYLSSIQMPSVLFSNGSVFVDTALCNAALSKSPDELITFLQENPLLNIYIKYWSSDQALSKEMVGVTSDSELPYETYKGLNVPSAFALLHSRFGKRIGLQTMVVPKNFDDFKNNILPFCINNDICLFAEPVIGSGNAFKNLKDSMLTDDQLVQIRKYLASGANYCEKRQYGELVLLGDKITPGIAIPPRSEDVVVNSQGELRSLEDIIKDKYFANYRRMSLKENACVCREYWENKSKG